jgi:hypothetical protein
LDTPPEPIKIKKVTDRIGEALDLRKLSRMKSIKVVSIFGGHYSQRLSVDNRTTASFKVEQL